MLVSPENVTDFIPQRPPMVMVDGLRSLEGDTAVTFFTVREDNVFIESGNLGVPGLVENIAQSAALRTGYLCKTEGVVVPLGFIGALKDLELNSLPATGSQLHTEIKLLHDVMNASVIEGRVYQGETLLARCEMKVFLLEQPGQ